MTAHWWHEVHHALFNGNGVAKRLLIAVVAFSSLITACITGAELYWKYRRDLTQIDATFEFLRTSQLPTLERSVWQYDVDSVQSQLKGMLQLPDIEFAAIEIDELPRWSAGNANSKRQRQAAMVLWHERGGATLNIGTLRVVASVDRVLARLWRQLLSDLLLNGMKTLMVAGFLLLVFQYLVTRHLGRVADFVVAIDPRMPASPGPSLVLDRPATGRWRPDILDAVSDAINALLRSLQQSQSELHQSEQNLRASETRLRALTEHVSALIYELDRDGRIIFANRSRGPQGRQVLGTQASRWLPEKERARFTDELNRSFAEGRRRRFELDYTDSGGTPRCLMVTIAPIVTDDGAQRAAVTALEIGELKHAEAAMREANRQLESRVRERTAALEHARDEAERANRAKSEFLSRMSHELRTPMNAILGFAQILEMSDPSPKQKRWAAQIRHAGDHLLQLIDELLDLARIEVGKLSVQPAPLELAAVVEEAAALVKGDLAARRITLAVQPWRTGLSVVADRTRLRQILVNLLSNAVKYNRQGGRIEVQARSLPGQRLRLTVSDTGLGIPQDKLGALFMPFERLGREHSEIEGTGIGLSLSQRLAGLMDCELGAESVEGRGSTFWIEMPLLDAEADVLRANTQPTPLWQTERRMRILYIEDNAGNRAVMQAFIDQSPRLELITAIDGRSGLDMARAQRPDAILLDIQLPEMNGYEVLDELKRSPGTRDIPVIAVSAEAMPADLERGSAAGFVAYLTKPISFPALMALLDTVAAGLDSVS